MRWGSLSWLTELIKGRAGTELPSGQEGPWRGCAPSQITVNNSGRECLKHQPSLTQGTGAQDHRGTMACEVTGGLSRDIVFPACQENWLSRGPGIYRNHHGISANYRRSSITGHHRATPTTSAEGEENMELTNTCVGRGET